MRYFLVREGAEDAGPFDLAQLRRMARAGDLGPDDALRPESGETFPALDVLGSDWPLQEPSSPNRVKSSKLLSTAALVLVFGLAMFRLVGPKPESPTGRAKARTMSHVKQLSVAMLLYVEESGGWLPPDTSSAIALYGPLSAGAGPTGKSDLIWKDLFSSLNPLDPLIAGNPNIGGMRYSDIERPESLLLLFDNSDWPNGTRIVGWIDGRVRAVPGPLLAEAVRNGYRLQFRDPN